MRGSARERLEELSKELVELGGVGLEALAHALPDSLRYDRRRELPEDAMGGSPLAGALLAFGSHAVPTIAWLLESSRPDARHLACLVAASLPDPRLSLPLGRVLLDPDPPCRQAALRALHSAPALASAELREALREASADRASHLQIRLSALEALRVIRDEGSLSLWIELLADPERELARAAHRSLRTLTAHDLGSLRAPWLRWEAALGQAARIEWLIDALGDSRPDLRRLAGEELCRGGLPEPLDRELREALDEGIEASEDACRRAQRSLRRWWSGQPVA